jgi:hypothetical protein
MSDADDEVVSVDADWLDLHRIGQEAHLPSVSNRDGSQKGLDHASGGPALTVHQAVDSWHNTIIKLSRSAR